MRRNNLLSIGEISKLTGAGKKALLYYERIGILKPVFIDPDTSYRFYSFNQIYLVALIMFCIETDIPLKELSAFIDKSGVIDLSKLLTHGKKMSLKKIKNLEKGLKFINFIEQQIVLQGEHTFGEIYKREFPKKYFRTIPYGKSFDNVDRYEVENLFFNIPYNKNADYEWSEHGFLYELSTSGIYRHVFYEVPKEKAGADCKMIPAGLYHCRQSESSQIEQTAEIFKEYLAGSSSFIAIETDIFSRKFDIEKPVYELRVIKT